MIWVIINTKGILIYIAIIFKVVAIKVGIIIGISVNIAISICRKIIKIRVIVICTICIVSINIRICIICRYSFCIVIKFYTSINIIKATIYIIITCIDIRTIVIIIAIIVFACVILVYFNRMSASLIIIGIWKCISIVCIIYNRLYFICIA